MSPLAYIQYLDPQTQEYFHNLNMILYFNIRRTCKKFYRLINRHTLIHDEFPVKIDMSIVKEKDKTYSKCKNNRYFLVAHHQKSTGKNNRLCHREMS